MTMLPTGNVPTTNLDASTDSPDAARADLLNLVAQWNQAVGLFGQSNGLALLDGNGQLLATELPAAALLSALLAVDGVGSGLDADKLQGVLGTSYITTDGSRAIDLSVTDFGPFTIAAEAVANNAHRIPLELATHYAAAAAGFGVEMQANLSNASGASAEAGSLAWEWTTATGGSEESDLILNTSHAGTVVEALRLRGQRIMEIPQITPSGSPPSGKWWFYATETGLVMQQHGGSAVTIGAAGDGTDHHTLLNLTVGDDHTQYMRTDGTRVLTGDLQLGANAVLTTDLSDDPDAPSSGMVQLYTKGGQLFYQSPSAVIGPILGDGVTSHHDLTNLTDGDDHTQYLLRQPTADVSLNGSAGDYDLVYQGTSSAHLLTIDAGANYVAIGTAGVSSGTGFGILQVSGTINATSVIAAQGTFVQGAAGGSTVIGFRTATGSTSDPVAYFGELGTASGTYVVRMDQKQDGAPALLINQHGTASAFAVEAAEVVVNDAGRSDIAFRVEGDSRDHLFYTDPATNSVSVLYADTTGSLNVFSDGYRPALYAFAGNSYSAPALSLLAAAAFGPSYTLVSVAAGLNEGISTTSQFGSALIAVRDLQGASPLGPPGDVAASYAIVTDAGDNVSCFNTRNAGSGYIMRNQDSSSTVTSILTQQGVWWLQDLGGDPSPPDSGLVALYMKSGGLYLEKSDGTIKTVTLT